MGYDWDTLEGRIRINLAKRIITESMPTLLDKKVLDVGCRVGNFSLYMFARGADVTGVDMDAEALELARRTDPTGNYICCNINDYQSSEKYDLIFMKDIIEHLDDYQTTLNKLRSMQVKGGRIIIGTQNSLSLTYLVDGLYTFLSGNVWRGYDPDHKHFFSPRKFRKVLKLAGYKPVKYYSTYHLPYRSVNMKLFGAYGDSNLYHGIDRLKLNAVWPFSITGWWICVVAEAI